MLGRREGAQTALNNAAFTQHSLPAPQADGLQMRLANGLNVMLGRDLDLAEERLRRFVAVYAPTLGTIARRHEYVDLRYPNGFALRIPDLKGT